MGFGILNLSVGERRDKATIEKTTKDVEKKLAGAHGGQAEFKLPLIFLDDVSSSILPLLSSVISG